MSEAPALEDVIRRAEAEARKRAGAALPAPAEPDEPEVAVVPRVTRTAATRRKALTRMQAAERRRTFARAYFHSGFSTVEALKTAGYKVPKTRSGQQSALAKLLHDNVVADELAALAAAARRVEEVQAVDTAKLFTEIAEADVFDFFEQDDDGHLKVHNHVLEMSKAQRRAVKKVKVTRTTRRSKDGGEEYVTVNTEIELWDRIQSLVWLAKIQKLVDDGADMEGFARVLAERLNQYQKRRGRVFEADYHEVVSD